MDGEALASPAIGMSTPCLLPARRNAQKFWMGTRHASPAAQPVLEASTRTRPRAPLAVKGLVSAAAFPPAYRHAPRPEQAAHLPSISRLKLNHACPRYSWSWSWSRVGTPPHGTRAARASLHHGPPDARPTSEEARASTLKATFPRVNCGLGSVPQFSWGCALPLSLSLVFSLAAIRIPQQRPLSSSPSRRSITPDWRVAGSVVRKRYFVWIH